MTNIINKTALVAAVILGSTAFVGAAQADPVHKSATTISQANARLAASEKEKEVEGTKADIREDKVEAAKKSDAMEDRMEKSSKTEAMQDKSEAKALHAHHKVKHEL
jgi:outer membrane murein-binding lipoprotein Lpp